MSYWFGIFFLLLIGFPLLVVCLIDHRITAFLFKSSLHHLPVKKEEKEKLRRLKHHLYLYEIPRTNYTLKPHPPFSRTCHKRDCRTDCHMCKLDRAWQIRALRLRSLYQCQQRGLRKTWMLPARFRRNPSPLFVVCSHAHPDYSRGYPRSQLPLEGPGCRSSRCPGIRL